jgi:hypothetical protein
VDIASRVGCTFATIRNELEEHPANKIYIFILSASINVQARYAIEYIMIGHSFLRVMTQEDNSKFALWIVSKQV